MEKHSIRVPEWLQDETAASSADTKNIKRVYIATKGKLQAIDLNKDTTNKYFLGCD